MSATANLPLTDGTLLENRYRLRGLLGQGGMSRVYRADDLRLGVRVAVKENLQTTAEARTQFEAEARMLARLSHPNLPRVTDHFTDRTTGRQYLVMDYIEGEDLETMLKRVGTLHETTALAWVRQILDALEYLHSQNPPVIHRDVKPSNIKITPQGKAVLVDFGIAKVYDPRQGTLTGARAVTPGYAPPEQYGLRTSARSDIYALGATLYTMLTGRVPPDATLRMSGEEQLIPPGRVTGVKLSPSTENAILRALQVQTTQRWKDATEFRAALEGRVAPVEPRTVAVSKARGTPRAQGTNTLPLILAIGGAGVLLLIVVLALSLNPVSSPPALRTPIATAAVGLVPLTPTPTQATATRLPNTSTPIPQTVVTLTVPPPTNVPTAALPVVQTVVVVVTATPAPATLTPTDVPKPTPTLTTTVIPTRTHTPTLVPSATATTVPPTATTTSTLTRIPDTATPTISPTPRPTATNTPEPFPTDITLENAVGKVKTVSVYREDMTFSGRGIFNTLITPVPGSEDKETTLIALKGDVDGNDWHILFQGAFLLSSGLDSDQGVELAQVGNRQFIKGPLPSVGATEHRWYEGPPSQNPGQPPPFNPKMLLDSFESSGVNWGVFKVGASETYDGKSCRIYTGDKSLTVNAFSKLGGIGGGISGQDLDLIDQWESKFWVCDDGYLHRISMFVEGHAKDNPAQKGSVQIAIKFFDFNGDIKITAPEGAAPLHTPTPIAITATPEAGAVPTSQAQQPRESTPAPVAKVAFKIRAANLLGDQNAKVTLVEYADFQCPFCERFHTGVAPQLIEQYVKTGKVNFVYKHMVFIGPESAWSAVASECAADQGKFWEYHDLLFARQAGENQGAFVKENLLGFGKELGLDMTRFEKCVQNDETLERVRADTQEAQEFGVNSTPTFFVNGQPLVGLGSFENFKALLDQALQQ